MNNTTDKVVANANGVDITENMVKVFAKRHGEQDEPSQWPGHIATLVAWVTGGAGSEDLGQLEGDAFLFESPETRDLFAPIRDAYEMRTHGKLKDVETYSKVSIREVIPDWDTFKQTLN